MFPGLSATIRVGLPSPGDPDGATGPGHWWITGGCRPAYVWDRSDRPRRGLAWFMLRRWRNSSARRR
jgi:hypothetical protein